jgi:hypothetical protein
MIRQQRDECCWNNNKGCDSRVLVAARDQEDIQTDRRSLQMLGEEEGILMAISMKAGAEKEVIKPR